MNIYFITQTIVNPPLIENKACIEHSVTQNK